MAIPDYLAAHDPRILQLLHQQDRQVKTGQGTTGSPTGAEFTELQKQMSKLTAMCEGQAETIKQLTETNHMLTVHLLSAQKVRRASIAREDEDQPVFSGITASTMSQEEWDKWSAELKTRGLSKDWAEYDDKLKREKY